MPDDEGDAEGETGQSLTSASSATSDSTPRGRGFTASKGWFDKFQKRYGIRNVPLNGEVASADTDAARRYVEDEFPKLINEDGYQPEQVFDMDETGLFWKRMPSRTFLFKDEVKRPGFKAYLYVHEYLSKSKRSCTVYWPKGAGNSVVQPLRGFSLLAVGSGTH